MQSPRLSRLTLDWWRSYRQQHGRLATLSELTKEIWQFLKESTPEQRRRRYGDAEYDWDYRVDTTSATVSFRDRLVGLFTSGYQPTSPEDFRDLLDRLPIDFRQFTFIDLGSGKGRALLMASDYPFRRIIGVELLPALHEIARQNVSKYHNDRQQCSNIELVCGDAGNFQFPAEPLVLYLFNPFPESVLNKVVTNLEASLRQHSDPVYIVYYNAILEHVLQGLPGITKIPGPEQSAIYVSAR